MTEPIGQAHRDLARAAFADQVRRHEADQKTKAERHRKVAVDPITFALHLLGRSVRRWWRKVTS